MNLPPPYPLAWPPGVKRTERRVPSQFRTELAGALDNVRRSLEAFARDSGRKIESLSMTSNASLNGVTGTDTGVAVWFTWDGATRCIAVDRYSKIEDNLQAIHHVLEARRTELRHAGIEIARAAFMGFQTALPSPGQAGGMGQHWTAVLGLPSDASHEAVHRRWRELVKAARENGDEARVAALNVARDQARSA